MKLFLSYAEEDEEVAQMIARWLREKDFDVYRWQDNRGGRFIEEMETNLNEADAFLALMSPHFLPSPWCRMERALALQREQDLQITTPGNNFIYVLKIVETVYAEAGLLRNYDWLDLTNQGNREDMLEVLANRLIPHGRAGPAASASTDKGFSQFRNRRDELEKVLRGLANTAGPHFWLVVAPPQLGKTWFLDRLNAEIKKSEPESSRWISRLVDLRELPYGVRASTMALLARLFGLEMPEGIERRNPRDIAREIIRSGKSHLCLLDSAELLDDGTANELRTSLGSIYRFVQEAGNIDVRLALVVASRRDEIWRGVAPVPRVSVLPLTEFSADIVQDALQDLARTMNRVRTFHQFRQEAERVHKLSEGLPALLVRCLQWIRTEEWLGMERLESQEMFEQIVGPYIQRELLSYESLFLWGQEPIVPWNPRQTTESRLALEHAFRVLAPYRLFTQSHLQHCRSDASLAQAMTQVGWSIEDLWNSISGTALLYRPLDEPWQELFRAIRRLLYRYFYRSDEQRSQAQRKASTFIKIWADRQNGTDQVTGMVECLWHEAVALQISSPGELEGLLSESAKVLSLAIRPSSAYTVRELREHAARKIKNDPEFQEIADLSPGLLDRLIEIVVAPPQEEQPQ